jgi:L-cysteine:1D-myo-inositol 2-amino-2-deoxy-alpha-D-glucopyranoside ligase
MHQAMVRMDGEKMSKSLGNLVFVSELLQQWDPRAVRLAIVANHYRTPWEWTPDTMPGGDARLQRWLTASVDESAPDSAAAVTAVRAALDDDLDTPTAVAAVDDAAAAGESVASAAALLGVFLTGEPQR